MVPWSLAAAAKSVMTMSVKGAGARGRCGCLVRAGSKVVKIMSTWQRSHSGEVVAISIIQPRMMMHLIFRYSAKLLEWFVIFEPSAVNVVAVV